MIKQEIGKLLKQAVITATRRPSVKSFLHRVLLYAKAHPGDRDILTDDDLRFLGFLVAHANISNSQVFQDLWVLFEADGKRNGSFVEFGATDGVLFSNSYLLENRFGWNGLLAEPAPTWQQALAANRKCQISQKCVWTKSGETLQFSQTTDAGYSTLAAFSDLDMHANERKSANQIEVETISLNDLLEEYGVAEKLDYMSIDTEGSELAILESFDFDRFDVRLLSIEHNFTSNEKKIDALLASKGYERRFAEFSMFDGWYRRT